MDDDHGASTLEIYFRPLGGVNDSKIKPEKQIGTGEASPPRTGASGEVFVLVRTRLWTLRPE